MTTRSLVRSSSSAMRMLSRELQVLTNNFGAQYGRNAGSIVNYITKSGTNAFHGTLFENYVGSWAARLPRAKRAPFLAFARRARSALRARPARPRSFLVSLPMSLAGLLGGPVLKDKLFFFAGLLFRRVTNGSSPQISTTLTPTPLGLTQLQAAFPNNPFVTSLLNQGPYSVKTGNPSPVATSNMAVCASTTACPAGFPHGAVRHHPAAAAQYIEWTMRRSIGAIGRRPPKIASSFGTCIRTLRPPSRVQPQRFRQATTTTRRTRFTPLVQTTRTRSRPDG